MSVGIAVIELSTGLERLCGATPTNAYRLPFLSTPPYSSKMLVCKYLHYQQSYGKQLTFPSSSSLPHLRQRPYCLAHAYDRRRRPLDRGQEPVGVPQLPVLVHAADALLRAAPDDTQGGRGRAGRQGQLEKRGQDDGCVLIIIHPDTCVHTYIYTYIRSILRAWLTCCSFARCSAMPERPVPEYRGIFLPAADSERGRADDGVLQGGWYSTVVPRRNW